MAFQKQIREATCIHLFIVIGAIPEYMQIYAAPVLVLVLVPVLVHVLVPAWAPALARVL